MVGGDGQGGISHCGKINLKMEHFRACVVKPKLVGKSALGGGHDYESQSYLYIPKGGEGRKRTWWKFFCVYFRPKKVSAVRMLIGIFQKCSGERTVEIQEM